MPVWNPETEQYDEESAFADTDRDEREERWRTAVLNELSELVRSVGGVSMALAEAEERQRRDHR
jgi:hypothetical protein